MDADITLFPGGIIPDTLNFKRLLNISVGCTNFPVKRVLELPKLVLGFS
jgi:hypothetical protein